MQNNYFEIMHLDRRVARIDRTGCCRIYEPTFLPYHLYLEESDEIEMRVNNITNFYYWCATRMLTLDRTYAKELLNSIGMKQAVTDRERAEIALSYRCASLTDVFWVREENEAVSFAEINLYENHLSNIFIDIGLRGRQYTVDNAELAKDISTGGCFPKAWRRAERGFQLLKDGGEEAVERELLASRICRCFDVDQVLYEKAVFDGEDVTVSDNMTSLEYSIVSMEAFEIYARNKERDLKAWVLELDRQNYYMMNIVDYLVGNTDRHWGNWGLLIRNEDNMPISLHKLMDFNRTFCAYDSLDGANCQTLFGEHLSQKEAAVQAVKEIGLLQKEEVSQKIFQALPQYYEMFQRRLNLLKETAGK